MAVPTCPKLEFIDCSETTITVSFEPLPNIYSYSLCYKEYEQSWETDWNSKEQSKRITMNGSSKTVECVAPDLNPGTTYCVRLQGHDINGDEQGEPGPELIIDTETVSCTPKSKKCVIS